MSRLTLICSFALITGALSGCGSEPVALPGGQPISDCARNSDCSVGEICADTVCVPGCESNRDCAGSDVCVAGGCVSPDEDPGPVIPDRDAAVGPDGSQSSDAGGGADTGVPIPDADTACAPNACETRGVSEGMICEDGEAITCGIRGGCPVVLDAASCPRGTSCSEDGRGSADCAEECSPGARIGCEGNTQVSYDSCGNVEFEVLRCSSAETCEESANDATCVENCSPETLLVCQGNAVYAEDSCTGSRRLVRNCGADEECSMASGVAACESTCVPDASTQCSGSSVVSVDSCGRTGAVVQRCSSNQQCVDGGGSAFCEDVCTPTSDTICNDEGNVVEVDSCSGAQTLVEDCGGRGCDGSSCVAEPTCTEEYTILNNECTSYTREGRTLTACLELLGDGEARMNVVKADGTPFRDGSTMHVRVGDRSGDDCANVSRGSNSFTSGATRVRVTFELLRGSWAEGEEKTFFASISEGGFTCFRYSPPIRVRRNCIP
jgi:hypothetical protein